MEELFGLSTTYIMMVLSTVFLATMGVVAVLAARNRIMVKLGLRNIPRRRGQAILIVVGIMLSTVIASAALGTGDTISFSIRKATLDGLKAIDEIVVYARADAGDSFGSSSHLPYERFERMRLEVADLAIDGLSPQLAETAPTLNSRTSLSEGEMRIVGIEPALVGGFEPFTSVNGGEVRLEDLEAGQAYINKNAAKELEAIVGDELSVVLSGGFETFTVRAIVERGGLAGGDPTLLLPLSVAQRMFDREGQVNLVAVSNEGGIRSGVAKSDEVTKALRVLFSDREVMAQIQKRLNDADFLRSLDRMAKDKKISLSESLRGDLASLSTELRRPELSDELISLLGENDVTDQVLKALSSDRFDVDKRDVADLLERRAEFRVFDAKHDFLERADQAGSGITAFFLIMSMFSITVGVLLIFLIFVMLAAARKSEMGMARAVGAKRRHLVQMFLFEGTAYSVVAAAIGVGLGLGVSAVVVRAANTFIQVFDSDFSLTTHFEPRSAVIAYCLGMAVTFATIAFSSYRVSRLNIVVAIRGLPEALLPATEPSFSTRLVRLLRAVARPVTFAVRGVRSLRHRRLRTFLGNAGLAVLWVVVFPIWIVDVGIRIAGFVWPYLLRGWLTFLLGLLLTVQAVNTWEQDSIFGAGVSLMILGLGLMLRTALKRTSLRAEARDRVAFTTLGLVMLVFWALPPGTFKGVTGELEGDFDVMFVSGIFMVAAAVWMVMYNADLLVRVLSLSTARIGKLRPVIVTAVAYPMSAKFRTGLTLAMFSLVVFTLVVMSVLIEGFSASITDDIETVLGDWDIEARVNPNTPIGDIRQAIAAEPKLPSAEFEAIGAFTRIGVGVREMDGEDPEWLGYAVRAVDDEFLDAARYEFKLIAEGYGAAPEEVWKALKADPTLTVVEGLALRSNKDSDDFRTLDFDSLHYDDESMTPVKIEVREPRTGVIVPLTVIGVLDRKHENINDDAGMIVSRSAIADAVPFPVPITGYLIRVAEGADVAQIAKDLEVTFIAHGMEAEALEDLWNEAVAAFKGFTNIFIGFMGLGLVVGIAALGVVSTRAVVERRQQIGVLRAIGYRRRMVQLSFLLESSFIALFGTAIGVILGLVLSRNAIIDIRAEEGNDAIRYLIPWANIVVITAVTFGFSLLATFVPARQASRIYPAEALRYE